VIVFDSAVNLGATVIVSLAGAGEALVDVGLGGEQAEGNLSGAEAAQRFQGQHQSRFLGNRFITADEQHAQQLVAYFAGKRR